jgi:peptidoglycan/xylan/chitin deacetylase (PgdA/CDA1 family)
MKAFLKRMSRYTGLLRISNELTPHKLSIMLYHGFCDSKNRGENTPNSKFMPISEFERHLKVYLKYGTPISLKDLLCKERLPPNLIVVTIDDGYANNYDLGLPVLKKYNFPATVFLTTGFIDRRLFLWTDWLEFIAVNASNVDIKIELNKEVISFNLGQPQVRNNAVKQLKSVLKNMPINKMKSFLYELQEMSKVKYDWERMPQNSQPLTWNQIREMKKSGLISFGGHTVSHAILSKCNKEEQTFEIVESKARIEKELNEECLILAYPNGKEDDFTEETIRLAKRANYRIAVTTNSGYENLNEYDSFKLKRWGTDLFSKGDVEFLISGGSLLMGAVRKRLSATYE